ncbi:hypothetical protein [Robbsia andropogonis]|uniref:hypothetical protein n=1 Tax=Robbsia andropogonis TaxID=28092 RepID=UPI0004AE9245|nr:hypothetical protein [Robbsia andropogonis]MCP1120417.1 hypothetical protein [Robbsia andropogonis]MCP1130229.1 hypothetical protein [Robbsia andropogonis]
MVCRLSNVPLSTVIDALPLYYRGQMLSEPAGGGAYKQIPGFATVHRAQLGIQG